MISRLFQMGSRYLVPGSSVSFWHTPIAPVYYNYSELTDYYIDFSSKTSYKGPFDEMGVPILDYRGEIGRQYNPCAVAQYALGWFQKWQRNDDDVSRQHFFVMADWLVKTLDWNQSSTGSHGFWLYHFDLDAYNVDAPWKSALAQAQGISVLVRAAHFSSNPEDKERYLAASHAAYCGLTATIEEGGLLRRDGDDLWLEEVVSPRLVAILDGCIFALFGVQDYYYATKNAASAKVFEQGSQTIARNLEEFDLGYWSRADLYQENPPMPASSFYHNLHIAQLNVLFDLTGENKFQCFANRWHMFQKSFMKSKRALLAKILFKLKYY